VLGQLKKRRGLNRNDCNWPSVTARKNATVVTGADQACFLSSWMGHVRSGMRSPGPSSRRTYGIPSCFSRRFASGKVHSESKRCHNFARHDSAKSKTVRDVSTHSTSLRARLSVDMTIRSLSSRTKPLVQLQNSAVSREEMQKNSGVLSTTITKSPSLAKPVPFLADA